MYRKGHFVKTIAVERRQNASSEDDEDSSYQSESESEDWQNRCQICGDDSAAGLILCDGEDGECTNAYHLRCVGLTSIPRGRWLCAECQSLEEFKRAHPEEFALCQTSESESDPNFSDPGSESSQSSEDDSYHEESEGVESTEAHSKPQSFVISDSESNPSSQYDPPDSSSSESDLSDESQPAKPEPKQRKKQPPPRRSRRNIRSMNATQRKRYIQRNLDPEYVLEDPIDQAWLIYRNIRNPRKRIHQKEETVEEKEENKNKGKENSPGMKNREKPNRSPEVFKKFVTELVQKEIGETKEPEGLAAKIHHRQTVARYAPSRSRASNPAGRQRPPP